MFVRVPAALSGLSGWKGGLGKWFLKIGVQAVWEMKQRNFTVQLTNPMLYDRLHILSAEYSVSVEYLINEAVKRMINDVDFVRSLRNGKQD